MLQSLRELQQNMYSCLHNCNSDDTFVNILTCKLVDCALFDSVNKGTESHRQEYSVAMATSCTRSLRPDGNRHETNNFMEKLMNNICDFYDQQDFIDIQFKLSNPDALVPAHRLILAAASTYFEELFKSDEGLAPIIDINDMDSDTFEHLITFCYTGVVSLTVENVGQMLKGAIFLQLDDVVVSCVDYLMEHMAEFTLQRAYSLERDSACALLHEKMREYEINHFMELSQSAEFSNWDAEKLQAIIESDNLKVNGEEDVFRAVKRWYEHDISARQQKLPDLIECLRLGQFDTNFLLRNVQTLPGCAPLAFKAISWISLHSDRSLISLKFTEPRRNIIERSEETTLLAVATYGQDILQYDNAKDEWKKYGDAKVDVAGYGVVLMDDSLIFIGGSRDLNATNVVKSWSLKTKTWKSLPPMNQPRVDLAVAILDGKIYAIGGCSREYLSSVEMYSTDDGWKVVASMITPRSEAGAVVLNGKIYVVGGSNGGNPLRSVECYEPSTNTWRRCADMLDTHRYPGVAVHKGYIYVAGGWNSIGDSQSVERYDPQDNSWTRVCSLNAGRYRITCVSMGDQLWAIGGYVSNSVSAYNAERDEWVEKNPLPKAGSYSCILVPRALLRSQEDT